MTLNTRLIMTGTTDTGRVRENNEDYLSWDAERGLALLADGMGGHNAGDVASRMCVEQLGAILLPALDRPLRIRPNKGVSRHATLVRRAIGRTNRAVFEAANRNNGHKGMGTTLALALFYEKRLVIAHAGDSRVYRLRNKKLKQMTVDHSLVQDLLDRGTIQPEEAINNPYSHVITRALGLEHKLTTDIQEFGVRHRDLYLLCSDGLTDLVDDEVIQEVLRDADGDWPAAAEQLVDLANQGGGKDNISVLLVAVGKAGSTAKMKTGKS